MEEGTVLRRGLIGLALGLVLVAGSRAQADPIVYTQPSLFPTGSLFASQNDPGGFGNFAAVYDNFTLSGDTDVTDVHWTGGYFNPATQGAIQSFDITFWSDVAGAPGASLLAQNIAGTANESFVGNDAGGFPIFNYSVILNTSFLANAGTTYWLSIVPTVPFPPQWGWYTGSGGDGIAYQDFFGGRSQVGTDFAFDLTGTAVPEPATLTLLGLGLAGFAGRKRIRQLGRS
jgi:hypothetical protein